MPRQGGFGSLPPDDPGRPEGATGPRPVARIARMFHPYRRQLLSLLVLILFSAGLGIISPFLLRDGYFVYAGRSDDIARWGGAIGAALVLVGSLYSVLDWMIMVE